MTFMNNYRIGNLTIESFEVLTYPGEKLKLIKQDNNIYYFESNGFYLLDEDYLQKCLDNGIKIAKQRAKQLNKFMKKKI